MGLQLFAILTPVESLAQRRPHIFTTAFEIAKIAKKLGKPGQKIGTKLCRNSVKNGLNGSNPPNQLQKNPDFSDDYRVNWFNKVFFALSLNFLLLCVFFGF